MFDNLIKIFLNREEKDWVGLLASSERWPTLREGFFARLRSRAADEEDPEEMLRLSRLLRLMQGTSERVATYADLLAEVQDTDEDLWEGMVTNRRAEFTTEFFQFLRFKLEALVRAQASASTARAEVVKAAEKDVDDIDEEVTDDEKARLKGERAVEKATEDAADAERDALARTAARLISICEAFDEATKDQETLEEAAENFKELLEVETLEEMNQKIEEMSQQGKMDPALVLTAASVHERQGVAVRGGGGEGRDGAPVFQDEGDDGAATTERSAHSEVSAGDGGSAGDSERIGGGVHAGAGADDGG